MILTLRNRTDAPIWIEDATTTFRERDGRQFEATLSIQTELGPREASQFTCPQSGFLVRHHVRYRKDGFFVTRPLQEDGYWAYLFSYSPLRKQKSYVDERKFSRILRDDTTRLEENHKT